MKAVTHLNPCKPLVQDSVVDTLMDLLDRAKKGEIQSVAIAATMIDRYTCCFGANVGIDSQGLVFELERMKMRILETI